MLKKVAVTGGLSCGKSSVCRLFQQLGAYVVSADEIVHKLLSPDTVIGQQVISLIGSETLSKQTIDRSIVAMKVFHDPKKLRALEKILHPAVRAEIFRHYDLATKSPAYVLFVAEVPLLFEAGMESDFDATIAVVADPELCKERFMAQGHTSSDYETRAARQLSSEEKALRATYVIYNSGQIEATRQQVETLFSTLAERQ